MGQTTSCGSGCEAPKREVAGAHDSVRAWAMPVPKKGTNRSVPSFFGSLMHVGLVTDFGTEQFTPVPVARSRYFGERSSIRRVGVHERGAAEEGIQHPGRPSSQLL